MIKARIHRASLFLLLTFGMLWLFDALVGIQVHPIQYLLIGAAMCLFYLLELSLSEHIGFIGAYVIAGMSIVGLVSTYTVAVLRSVGRGTIVASVLGLLYAYLLALLSLEHYALLVGSIGLFFALAAVILLPDLPSAYQTVDVVDGASLTGKVVFKGKAPEPEKILINKNKEVCGTGYRKKGGVRVSASGGLR